MARIIQMATGFNSEAKILPGGCILEPPIDLKTSKFKWLSEFQYKLLIFICMTRN